MEKSDQAAHGLGRILRDLEDRKGSSEANVKLVLLTCRVRDIVLSFQLVLPETAVVAVKTFQLVSIELILRSKSHEDVTCHWNLKEITVPGYSNCKLHDPLCPSCALSTSLEVFNLTKPPAGVLVGTE